jgi:hypothetical protein
VTQVEECLPSKHEAFSSNLPSEKKIEEFEKKFLKKY